MREESHLEDMRAAIRGDFERLAERRGDQGLMRVADGEAPAPVAETDAVPVSDTVSSVRLAPESPRTRRSWFSRFVSG